MTKLYITEFPELAIGPAGRVGQVPEQSTLAEQVVDYTAGHAEIGCLQCTDAPGAACTRDSICSVLFGTAPVAATTNARMVAGQTEYHGVPVGSAFKVSAITNT